jgi:DNA repair protein RecN (Recombination protein N)
MPATLSSLRIRNLALVEDLTWLLQPGFTAVTGETGSGKSIIVGALKLLVGERADKSLVRSGADSCSVEAVFDLPDPALLTSFNAQLESLGVEPCESGQLLLRRSFSPAGANRQFVNGSPTTLATLKELGSRLVDLHGPHDHQSLLSTERQLALLDACAGSQPLLDSYSHAYRQITALQTELEALSGSEAALERERDLLTHQTQEIESANLSSNEETGLLARYQLVSNGRRLLDLCHSLLGRLSEADDALLSRLNEAGRLLRDFERLDPNAAPFTQSHLQAVSALEDLVSGLRHYADQLEIDPDQLRKLEDRVSQIESLKRKYGGSIDAVLAFGQEAAARLSKLNSRSSELERITREIETSGQQLAHIGAQLTTKRSKAAPELAKHILAHLRDLGFKNAGFSIPLLPLPKPGPHGFETVDFLFAPNPGEPAKPLRSIASSGEISRVMLAIKSSLAAQDTVSLLVFDEIDANVGGEIAQAVGAKMRQIATGHQVLCISHFPQVAALASEQFVVSKEFTQNRTFSRLEKVEGDSRIEEIARMLGGKADSARNHARTLLQTTAEPPSTAPAKKTRARA